MADLLERARDLLLDLERDPSSALATIPELYAEGMTFRDPIQEVHGRDAFVEVTRRLIERARSLEVRVHEAVAGPDALFLTWTMAAAFPLTPRVTIEGVSHLTVRDGRIIGHRDYFDLAGSAFDAVPGVRAVYRAVVSRFG